MYKRQGKGLKDLLYEVKNLLANCPKEVTVYEPEIDPALSFLKDEPYAVEVDVYKRQAGTAIALKHNNYLEEII